MKLGTNSAAKGTVVTQRNMDRTKYFFRFKDIVGP